jgi:hypothetical protein
MKITRQAAFATGTVALGGLLLAGAFLLSDAASGKDARRGTRALAGESLAARERSLATARGATARRPARSPSSGTTAPATTAVSRGEGSAMALAVGAGGQGDAALAASARKSAGGALEGSRAAQDRRSSEKQQRALAALAKVDWDHTLKDLVTAMKAARGGADPATLVEGAEIRLALAEAAQQLGLKTTAAALGDPTVRSVVVPSWLKALGVNLDDAQAAAVSERCLDVPSATAGNPATFLAARLSAIQSRIALEQSVAQVLSPEQMTTYATNVAFDPLMKAQAAQMDLQAATPSGLASVVTAYWTRSFGLDGPGQEAARTVAAGYVAQVLAVPPVAPNLDPEALRLARLARTTQLITLQQQAEQTLGANASLADPQKDRVATGSSYCLRLGVSR